MSPEPREFADSDIRDVDPAGLIGQSGPGGMRGAIIPESLLKRGTVSGTLVNRVQDAGAKLGGEESAQAGLNRNINFNAAGLYRVRGAGQIFQPLRDLDRANTCRCARL